MAIPEGDLGGTQHHSDGAFGSNAFIIAETADCHFDPSIESAVRVTPPYGAEVTIVRDEGTWVLIKFCGKDAWSPRGNLSATLEPMRAPVEGEPAGGDAQGQTKRDRPVRYTFNQPQTAAVRERATQIEYGPRGGRFVRTAKGFRRYF